MRLLRGLGTFLHELDEMIFPSSIYCICCGSMIDRTRSYSLCDDCIRRFHWNVGPTCEKCGKALAERDFSGAEAAESEGNTEQRLCYNCMIQLPLYEKGFSCVTYGLHERELMMDLKYAGRGYVGRKCGDMMFDRIEEEIRQGSFSPTNAPIDIIVPVPISDERYRERGYNQSVLMASQLAARWRGFVRSPHAETGYRAPILYEDMLFRARETKKLRGLNPAERALELEGAFKVHSRYARVIRGIKDRNAAPAFEGKVRAMLIDDIQTTNATANACTKALLDAGVSEVFFMSWASGGNRRPPV